MPDTTTPTSINKHATILPPVYSPPNSTYPRNTNYAPRNTTVWTKDEIARLVYYRDLYRNLSWGDFANLGLFPGRTVKTMQTRYSLGRRILQPNSPTQQQLQPYSAPVYPPSTVNDVPSLYTFSHRPYPTSRTSLGAYEGNTITLSQGEIERPFAPPPVPSLGPGAYEGNTIVIKRGADDPSVRTNTPYLESEPLQLVMPPRDIPIRTIGEVFPRDGDGGQGTHEYPNGYYGRCQDRKGLGKSQTSFIDIPDNFDTVRSDGWTAFRARPESVTPGFEPSQSPDVIDLTVTPPDAGDVMDIDESRVQQIARECSAALAPGAEQEDAEAAFDLLTFNRLHVDADMQF
ncbi:hypothetical protein ASPVEDRAFT_153779 [Aspergillus versicolor CBS 583.65]|uniref:Myb-like domain-containing protein n=1 Tax=Aspergillus versicolor CBS 583.65 TaxID=1036611 RepID=A0A1L9PVP2_ASPVE|nr:uncharacterized protein ASPVEDRAFT_153779 [Aspergillus versicolor CBS 583.65]OJJ05591.1 hypothetical protein ASPVEDRAFT_153779 [Aspergillus versicolor CBS 583.65]